ncbi:hypothetical protein I6J24_06410 [Corynebacterium kroppenstedtii]|uniref:hypothetical protein n=1 Tax=Corynebacterium pseudokroppenstedtii TaxID=2804917 RepID=UPI0019510DDA|nr:hypothetical protein [Corynebacterium pseudokroppenstedtii]MCF6793780.1 hypothetical protein [Corynebacterium pseudokroppenstedtii]MDK7147307.1 hypothetical protein [Corynebacterium pseudokroppenstedtii]MDU6480096.1 hypothetical protein [Corynebacterium kroppenstedtii]QRP13766.1 hypothetical protein I6J24_06410 [Corynebacterium kroppenstedtii]
MVIHPDVLALSGAASADLHGTAIHATALSSPPSSSLSQSIADAWNSAEQWIISLSVWGQAPIVIPIVVLVSMGVAWAVLHLVDKVGIPIENAINDRNLTADGDDGKEDS